MSRLQGWVSPTGLADSQTLFLRLAGLKPTFGYWCLATLGTTSSRTTSTPSWDAVRQAVQPRLRPLPSPSPSRSFTHAPSPNVAVSGSPHALDCLPSFVLVTAGYSVPTDGWVINQVPIVMFLLTHPYFLSYHTLATCVLRRAGFYNASTSLVYRAVLVAGLAYTTAFVEAWSISGFPHYVGCVANLTQCWQLDHPLP